MMSKEARGAAVEAARQAVLADIATSTALAAPTSAAAAGPAPGDVGTAFKNVQSAVMRRVVLTEGVRADGRKVDEIRPIYARAHLLPRTHGSALFTRGETQVRMSWMHLFPTSSAVFIEVAV